MLGDRLPFPGAEKVVDAFETYLEGKGARRRVHGQGDRLQRFLRPGTDRGGRTGKCLLRERRADRVAEIMEKTVLGNEFVEDLLYVNPDNGGKIVRERDIPFFAGPGAAGFHDTGLNYVTDIEDYISRGGYSALAKALSDMSPEEVIAEVKRLRSSRPRGRRVSRRASSGNPAGGPGARSSTSSAMPTKATRAPTWTAPLWKAIPTQVIEGMIIAAYAIGATEGYIYCRFEYPLAVKTTKRAIEQARAYGLLGQNILGTGFNFDIISTAAPAPSSAANRRPSWLLWKARSANPAESTSTPSKRVSGTARATSTTWRPTPTCP